MLSGIAVPRISVAFGRANKVQWSQTFLVAGCVVVALNLLFILLHRMEIQPFDDEYKKEKVDEDLNDGVDDDKEATAAMVEQQDDEGTREQMLRQLLRLSQYRDVKAIKPHWPKIQDRPNLTESYQSYLQ